LPEPDAGPAGAEQRPQAGGHEGAGQPHGRGGTAGEAVLPGRPGARRRRAHGVHVFVRNRDVLPKDPAEERPRRRTRVEGHWGNPGGIAMPSASQRQRGAVVKANVVETIPRAYTRRGKQLLKEIWRSLNDPETLQNVEQLRDQIIFQAEEKTRGGKAVGLAGPAGGEGTSSLAILVGLMLSEFRHNRVLFVDGRLERKNFAVYHEMFGLTRNPLTYNN